mmetsp:Transcript_6814/g.17451  ORF Transcript_6814/g.17451 Transcript_6814/m.17451 type:complete len:376 (-) Transcript_6814:769-1896(-)
MTTSNFRRKSWIRLLFAIALFVSGCTVSDVWHSSIQLHATARTHSQEQNRAFDETLELENKVHLAACRHGHGSSSEKCANRLKEGKDCLWYEEVGSFLRQTRDEAWFRRRALRPCKSRPKLVMNEFPEPVCTKETYLHKTDVLLCDSWGHQDRTSAAVQRLWYQQVGVWEVFRQSYYNSKSHRAENGAMLCNHMTRRMNLLEYGSGIAPFSDYLLKHCPQNVGGVTIVDIPAEHFYFGLWRLRYKMDVLVGTDASLKGIEVGAGSTILPENTFDLVVMITVFEHLPNPIATAKNLFASLSNRGPGMIYEDFGATEIDSSESSIIVQRDTSDPNLGAARVERKATLRLFQDRCTLVDGDMGVMSKRLWKCRQAETA